MFADPLSGSGRLRLDTSGRVWLAPDLKADPDGDSRLLGRFGAIRPIEAPDGMEADLGVLEDDWAGYLRTFEPTDSDAGFYARLRRTL